MKAKLILLLSVLFVGLCPLSAAFADDGEDQLGPSELWKSRPVLLMDGEGDEGPTE